MKGASNTARRLNLGSGNDYLEGWINVDIINSYKVDVVADLSKPFPFEEESIDQIKAADILEHFTREDGELFLKECYRVLKTGGKITIRTHNIQQIISQFRVDSLVMIHFIYGDTAETGIFGSHKYAYTRKELERMLHKNGFDIQSFQIETTNFRVTAVKKKNFKLQKLNIAVIMQSPDMGGAETYMLSLIKQYLAQGHTVVVGGNKSKFLMMANSLSIKTKEIPIILDIIGNIKGLLRSISRLPYALYIYIRYLQYLKHQGTDVILMSGFSEKLLVTVLTVFIQIPVVWIEYGRLETVFKRNFYLPKIIYRLVKDLPQYIIVPSKNTMESLIMSARVSLSKIKLIPCGITPGKRFKSIKEKLLPAWRDAIIIGSVSRLTREKGQQYLIKAIPLIVRKEPSTRFIIIGEGPDMEYFTSLIEQLKIESFVKLTGYVNNLNEYYSAMDIFVFPTVWDLEGFGLVIPEAMSYKLPVVASHMGPVSEIVDDKVNGLLVPPADDKALAQAVISLAKNKNQREILGEKGFQKVKKYYDIKIISGKVLEVLYDAVI